jgi:hypothetical protein
VPWMDRDMKKSKEFVKYVPGTGKQFVELSVTLDGTGKLIEWVKEDDKTDKKERKSASGTDGREQDQK